VRVRISFRKVLDFCLGKAGPLSQNLIGMQETVQ
jgi:hypothetical protein